MAQYCFHRVSGFSGMGIVERWNGEWIFLSSICLLVCLTIILCHFACSILFFNRIFFFSRATDQQYGIKTKKSYLKTTRSCMDTPMNMYSSKGHIKRLTGAFFLADIQTMTYTQVHRYLGHASMFLLTLH